MAVSLLITCMAETKCDDVVLTSGEPADINAALANIKIAGERYPEELEKRTGL